MSRSARIPEIFGHPQTASQAASSGSMKTRSEKAGRRNSTARPSPARTKIQTIETLRTWLMFWIVTHHYFVQSRSVDILGPFEATWRTMMRNNQSGAFAFIALSGFITHYTMRSRLIFPADNVWFEYFLRRFPRILFTFEMAVLLAYIFTLPALCDNFPSYWEQFTVSLPTIFGVQTWFGLREDWNEKYVYPLNGPTWTVSTLLACWVAYPICAKYLLPNKYTSLIFGTAAVFSLGMFFCWTFPEPSWHTQKQSHFGPYMGFMWFPPLCFPQFFTGVFIAEASSRLKFNPSNSTQWVVSVTSLAMILLFWACVMFDIDVTFGLHFQYVNYARIMPFLLGAALATHSEALLLGGPLCAPLQWFGKYTLAMYVFQAPWMRVFDAMIHGFPVRFWPFFPSFRLWGLCMALFSCFCVFWTRYVETPFIQKVVPAQHFLGGRSLPYFQLPPKNSR